MSLRTGGVSAAPFNSLNIGRSVGDAPEAVAENRARFVSALGAEPVWMKLVHGANVLHLQAGGPLHPEEPADAAWTQAPRVACAVTAADCLPVFFALHDGSAVGAAHAGWRGLAAGVLEATLHAMCKGTGAAPADLQVWLGPCIGPRQFEVGVEVLQAFGVDDTRSPAAKHFLARQRLDGSPGWLADLRGLAQARLQAAGVTRFNVSTACTVEDPSRFFSYRRDLRTGRHAAAIWRE